MAGYTLGGQDLTLVYHHGPSPLYASVSPPAVSHPCIFWDWGELNEGTV